MISCPQIGLPAPTLLMINVQKILKFVNNLWSFNPIQIVKMSH